MFESLEGATAVLLELAIFPPRRVDEGFGTDSGFSLESKESTCRMDVDTAAANRMFESAAAALEIENSKLVEAERARAQGVVDLSEEVLSKMRTSVGGLGPELKALARRILISRQLPVTVFKDLGNFLLRILPFEQHSLLLLLSYFLFSLSDPVRSDSCEGTAPPRPSRLW